MMLTLWLFGTNYISGVPYYFFKEHALASKWELLFALESFDEAKTKQQDLRRVEKLDGCVVHVVRADTEEAAHNEHRKVFKYSGIKRTPLKGKHAVRPARVRSD